MCVCVAIAMNWEYFLSQVITKRPLFYPINLVECHSMQCTRMNNTAKTTTAKQLERILSEAQANLWISFTLSTHVRNNAFCVANCVLFAMHTANNKRTVYWTLYGLSTATNSHCLRRYVNSSIFPAFLWNHFGRSQNSVWFFTNFFRKCEWHCGDMVNDEWPGRKLINRRIWSQWVHIDGLWHHREIRRWWRGAAHTVYSSSEFHQVYWIHSYRMNFAFLNYLSMEKTTFDS